MLVWVWRGCHDVEVVIKFKVVGFEFGADLHMIMYCVFVAPPFAYPYTHIPLFPGVGSNRKSTNFNRLAVMLHKSAKPLSLKQGLSGVPPPFVSLSLSHSLSVRAPFVFGDRRRTLAGGLLSGHIQFFQGTGSTFDMCPQTLALIGNSSPFSNILFLSSSNSTSRPPPSLSFLLSLNTQIGRAHVELQSR